MMKIRFVMKITTLAMMAVMLALVMTSVASGNEIVFILGTDVNKDTLQNAASDDTITSMLDITIFGMNETIPQNFKFPNYQVIFIESPNETMVAEWGANITAARENGSAVIGYNLSTASTALFNTSLPNIDLGSSEYTDIERYWVQGGSINMENMLKFMGQKFCGKWTGSVIPAPVVMHPEVNITFIINSDPNRYYLNRVISERSVIADRFNVTVVSGASAANLIDVSDQDVIMLHMIGANEFPLFKDKLLAAKNSGAHIGLTGNMNDPFKVGTIDMDDPAHSALKDYNHNGGYTNMENWIRCIGATLEGVYIEHAPAVPPAIPRHGIYHPDAFPRIFENSTEYLEWYADDTVTGRDHSYNASAPTIGIVRNKLADDPIYYKTGDAIIRELESKGCNVIYTTNQVCAEDADYFTRNKNVLVDAIISLNAFYFNYQDQEVGVDNLKKFNVPVLKGLIDHYSTPAQFNNSSRGLNPVSIPFQVTQPEIDGCIDYIWVAGKVKDPDLEYDMPHIPQVRWLCERAISWAHLGRTGNTDKKICIIYYNHEGGKNNIGASYLDIAPGFTLLLERLQAEGYDIGSGAIPNGSEFIDLFIESRNVGSWAPGALEEVVNSGGVTLVPVDDYLSWYETLPCSVRADIEARWGEPPGSIMVYDGSFVIPAVEFGNVIFMPQPTRGALSSDSAIYHDKTLPPTHQYLAAYFWVNNVFDAGAIIHFGTHGTQEWLPGNEVGLWRYDYPAIMVDDTPVIYPYIMDNVGEGTQAKRRGNAVIIDHLTPPIVAAGIYDELAALHDKIHDHENADDTTEVLYRSTIIELYDSLGLADDLGVTCGQLNNMTPDDFENFINPRVHDYLHELKSTLMPLGLHIFGAAPEDERLVCMVRSMLREDFTDHIANVIRDVEVDEDKDEEMGGGDAADRYASDLLNETLLNKTDVSLAQTLVLGLADPDPAITSDLNTAEYYSALLGQTTREIDQMLRALDAEYIEPGPGNDPIRNPEALPTGRNFYSFDQRKFPDRETEALGVILTNQFLQQYTENHNGSYPDKVDFVLWSVETMRHRGIMEAQIYSFIGVKPKRDNGRITDFEVIPPEDMTHPRIDVLLMPSGLYRDTFPYQLELMDKAIRMVAKLDEKNEMNYVRYNSLKLYDAQIAAGYNETTASYLSRSRIFSEAPGAYGTGLVGAVTASETWDNESELADLFTARMSNIYGQDIWGGSYEDVFKMNLRDVDAGVHSDSSNLFGIIDNDDYYQYLGGLALAVRSLSGETPELYVADLTNADDPQMKTLESAFRKELRSRSFNPKWIGGMMEHDYGGAREFMKFTEYMWGWNAMTPDMVTDGDWDRIYDIYINDKYEIDLDTFLKNENPEMYQSMIARMLETTRKLDREGNPYWNASDKIVRSLVKEYVESVVNNGVTCCHHTCGNPLLDEYVQGLLSAAGVSEQDAGMYCRMMDEVTKRQSAVSGKGLSDYVEGYEMQDESTQSADTGPMSFSGSDLMGALIVLLIISAIYVGFRRGGV